MATDWANILEWGGAKEFRLPTAFELARGSIPDSAKGAENDFAPTAQNAALLQALGYGGSPVAGDAWTDDARTWLHNNGYQLGVGHQPGTKAQGRAEYFGLIGPDGKFVQGQSDPTMQMSDSWGDIVAPFALMAAPLAAQAMFGQAAGAGGAASGLGETAASLGGGGFGGMDSFMWAMDPTGASLAAMAPEIGTLSSAAASPFSALGAGAADLGGLTWGGSSLGAFGGAPLGVAGGEATASIGGSAGLGSADKAALYGAEGYGPGMTGAQTSAYDSVLGATGSKGAADMVANSSIGSSIVNGIGKVSDLVGGGANLGSIVGGLLGAASSKDGATTQSRDPWSAAQPFLKGLLADADKMRQDFAANPFTPQQQQAYGNAYAGLDQARAALPGLLSWGQNAMQRQSTVPSYQQLFGGAAMQPAPTMQAGGPGGLPEDRLKHLMVRGQGLIG